METPLKVATYSSLVSLRRSPEKVPKRITHSGQTLCGPFGCPLSLWTSMDVIQPLILRMTMDAHGSQLANGGNADRDGGTTHDFSNMDFSSPRLDASPAKSRDQTDHPVPDNRPVTLNFFPRNY